VICIWIASGRVWWRCTVICVWIGGRHKYLCEWDPMMDFGWETEDACKRRKYYDTQRRWRSEGKGNHNAGKVLLTAYAPLLYELTTDLHNMISINRYRRILKRKRGEEMGFAGTDYRAYLIRIRVYRGYLGPRRKLVKAISGS
jgi:hypothetical protein